MEVKRAWNPATEERKSARRGKSEAVDWWPGVEEDTGCATRDLNWQVRLSEDF